MNLGDVFGLMSKLLKIDLPTTNIGAKTVTSESKFANKTFMLLLLFLEINYYSI